jgi:hypothetical protein
MYTCIESEHASMLLEFQDIIAPVLSNYTQQKIYITKQRLIDRWQKTKSQDLCLWYTEMTLERWRKKRCVAILIFTVYKRDTRNNE